MTATLTFAPERTLLDRCDRCIAVATLRIVFRGGRDLLLCWHHATQHWDVLVTLDVRLEQSPPTGSVR